MPCENNISLRKCTTLVTVIVISCYKLQYIFFDVSESVNEQLVIWLGYYFSLYYIITMKYQLCYVISCLGVTWPDGLDLLSAQLTLWRFLKTHYNNFSATWNFFYWLLFTFIYLFVFTYSTMNSRLFNKIYQLPFLFMLYAIIVLSHGIELSTLSIYIFQKQFRVKKRYI